MKNLTRIEKLKQLIEGKFNPPFPIILEDSELDDLDYELEKLYVENQ